MSKGHIATLVPMSSERAKAIAARERFTPARMYRAIHKRLKNEPDLKARIVDAVLENACDRDSRWHGPAVELVLRGDPDLRAAINADARADLALSAPRIVIVGPGAVATQDVAFQHAPLVDHGAQGQEPRIVECERVDNAATPTSAHTLFAVSSGEPSAYVGVAQSDATKASKSEAARIDALQATVQAQSAQVAALTALVERLLSALPSEPAPGPIQTGSLHRTTAPSSSEPAQEPSGVAS